MFEKFRKDVKEILNKNQITYSQLAKETGLSENTIKFFMCGAGDSRRVAESIADVLNYKLIYSNGVYEIATDIAVFPDVPPEQLFSHSVNS